MPLVLMLALLGQEAPRPETPEVTPEAVPVERASTEHAHEQDAWSPDPNRTHYFYAPSGMMLRKGEGSISQAEGLLSEVSYGVTDYLTLQAGAVVPAWVFRALNAMGGIKIGGSLGEQFHVAVGAQALFVPPILNVRIPVLLSALYGTLTCGTPDLHLSLTAAVPFSTGNLIYLHPGGFSGPYLFAFSGNFRVSRHVALITENWVTYSPTAVYDSPLSMTNSAGVRLFGEHWALSLGGVRLSSNTFLPWLDLAYNFGG